MKDSLSPEEKLLRLIKGQKKVQVSAGAGAIAKKPPANIRQKAAVLAFIIAGAYLLWNLIYPFTALKNTPLVKPQLKETAQRNLNLKDDARRPIEFYRQELSGRQIFGGAQEGAAGGPASGVNVDLTKDINLVGIISGEPAQAVIEDVKTKKTYYLSRGQFIGELRVDDIQDGKIIINYHGQKYELYM